MRSAVGLLMVGVIVTGALGAVLPALGKEPAACQPSDRLAEHAAYDDWQRTVLSPQRRLPNGYKPPDLVSASYAEMDGRFELRQVVIDDLRRMRAAAIEAGVRLQLRAAYRSAEAQASLRDALIRELGLSAADRVVALPGHSEHQLGTAIDFAATPGAYAWLTANAWHHGFVQSYGGSGGCVAREVWHFRYFGPDLAQAIVASGLEASEYLTREPAARGRSD